MAGPSPAWRWRRRVAIAIGGMVGAGVRWGVLTAWPLVDGFSWSLLACNALGSFVLGAALGEQWRHPRQQLVFHDLVGVGFCGGLTTMSTFSVEIASLARAGSGGTAALFVACSVGAALLAVVAGAAAVGRVRALRLPVEGSAP